MTARVPTDSLRLSIVLATDTYETIRPVLSALSRQACARKIEPIIVLLGGDVTSVRLEDLECIPAGDASASQVLNTKGKDGRSGEI